MRRGSRLLSDEQEIRRMHSAYRTVTRPVHFSIVLLLLVGYAMMGFMMAEQNRTITAQRDLIRKLFQDTVRLSTAQMQKRVTIVR
jgi:p-aminobenzoyl-glutamate transporter AbgT